MLQGPMWVVNRAMVIRVVFYKFTWVKKLPQEDTEMLFLYLKTRAPGASSTRL